MPSKKIAFTKSALVTEPLPVKSRIYLHDVQTRGLLLDIQASGTKTFQVYRKINGKPRRIVLGRFSPALPETRDFSAGTDPISLIGNGAELNIRMARKLADAVNASIDKGVDPALIARRDRLSNQNEMTLRQAFDRYFSDHLIAHDKRSALLIQDDFARYLGKVPAGQKKPKGKEKVKSLGSVDWEQRKLSSISQTDIRKMMISIKENAGSRTANRSFVLLRSIYNKIIAWRLYEGENPCIGIEKFKENSRERFVTGEELPRFMAAVEKIDHQDFKDFVLLSLYTGARRANVLAMRWQDLNFHAGILTVPSEFSKNGSPLTIPITTLVRDLLEQRRVRMSETSPFVFPAKSITGHMSPPNKRWKALLADAGITNLRLHDLRRSLGSWAAMNGTSLPIIGKMLGHKSSQATSVYAHLQFDPVKVAMEAATTAMLVKSKE